MQNQNNTLKDRLKKGAGVQFFSQGVQILIRLIEVPLYLSFWNAQLYGEWLMISAIPVYLSMADGGFAQTSCREITIRASAGDRAGAVSVYQSSWALLLILSFFIGGSAVIITKLFSLNSWLNFKSIGPHETSTVFVILVFYVLLGFQESLLTSGFWAANRYPESAFWTTLSRLAEIGFAAITLYTDGGPVKVALSLLMAKLIGVGIIWALQRKVAPWLQLGFRHVDIQKIKTLFAPSIASLAFPLGNALNIQGIRLLIGLVLGPSAVAAFVPLRTLSNFVVQPRQIVNRLTEPEMAIAYGSKNDILFRRLFFQSVRVSFWGCFAVALFLIPASYFIFPFWTAGEIDIHWPTYILLLVAAIINSIWYAALMVSYSTNRHGVSAIYYFVIYGAVYNLFAYFAIQNFGMAGPAAVLIIIESIMVLLILKHALKLTGSNTRELLNTVTPLPAKELTSVMLFIKKSLRANDTF